MRVAMENLQGCSDSVAVVLRGLEVPVVSVVGAEAVTTRSLSGATGVAAVEISLATDQGNTVVDWVADGVPIAIGMVSDVWPDAGSIGPFGTADEGMVEFSAIFVGVFPIEHEAFVGAQNK